MRYLSDLGTKSVKVFKRFPLTSLWALCGSLFMIGVLQAGGENFFENYRNELFTLSLGVSWLMAAKFFIEQFSTSTRLLFLNLLPLGLLLLYYFTLPEYSTDNAPTLHIRWLLYLLAGHVFLFFAPFVLHWNSAAFWNYLKDIFISLGRSLLFSGVLYLGLVFAMLAVDSLFNISIEGQVYGQVFIFCLGIVNTGVYLSDFPKNIKDNDLIYYNKPLEVFVKFILTPLIAVYLLILYLYSLKILIAWELPEGWISTMISVLALLGFIIHIIIEPVRREHPSFLIRKFFPIFYILLAPLMILLFVAVFKRISDYNFTESRYFLLLLSCWILSMLAYLLLSKKKQLRVLPISLFLLIIFSSFGPWGAFQISIKAQLSEFNKIYNAIEENGNILSKDKADRFNNITSYLASRNKLKNTEPVLGFDPENSFPEFNKYNIGRKILDSLEVEILEDSTQLPAYQYFFRNTPVVVELRDYDVFTELNYGRVAGFQNADGFELRENKGNLKIYKKENLLLQLELEKNILSLARKYGSLTELNPEELEFNLSNKKGDFKIIFLNLNFSMEDEKPVLTDAKIYLFYKERLK